MMFSDKYRLEMNRLKANPDTLEKIKERSKMENNTKKKLSYTIAAAACFALIACAAVAAVVMNKPSGKTPDITTGTPVSTAISLDGQTYGDIFKAVNSQYSDGYRTWNSGMFFVDEEEEAVAEAPEAEADVGVVKNASGIASDDSVTTFGSDDSVTTFGSDEDYTGTNVQVEGIDEADVVKTDGKYIYTMRSGRMLSVVSAENGKLELLSETDIREKDSDFYFTDMFINGDRLIVLGTKQIFYTFVKNADGEEYESETYKPTTCILIYDVSDRKAPKLISTLSQDGDYSTARLSEGIMYVISNYYIYNEIDEDDPSTFVPCFYTNGECRVLPSNCIYIGSESTSYTVISSVDLTKPTAFADSKSVLGGSNALYCNGKVMVIANTTYSDDTKETQINGKNATVITGFNQTNLTRLELENGIITPSSSCTVKGTPLNQFSLDIYNDVLRIVMTEDTSIQTIFTDGIDTYDYSSSRTTALYTFGRDMAMLGSITDISPDEMVYSVRFSGDTGYFVTFRQTDPLFAVDLSDPSSPKILSALKIPGFSSYLHPYSDGLLFGFGNDADEETGWMENLKLSMFDVSDPTSVTEKHKLILDDGIWSQASYDHKAIFVSSKYRLIAFPVDERYEIYSYDETKGFEKVTDVSITDTEVEYDYASFARAFVIGDCFYVCSDRAVRSYSLDGFSPVDSLTYERNEKYYDVEIAEEDVIAY